MNELPPYPAYKDSGAPWLGEVPAHWVAGINKLRQREYHRPPLCEPLGDGLFEVRVGRKDIARGAWFYVQGQRIVVVHCFVKKTQKTPAAALELARRRKSEYQMRFAGR